MFKKIIHFVKYNNAVVFIILAVFVIGSGVFAQTEVGQEFIGEKQSETQGVDNTLLLDIDLDIFDMDFKIEKIETDEHYYYVTYTYLDLRNLDNIWQYSMQEKIRKVSKIIRVDLGEFLAEELLEQYEARINDLKIAQNKAEGDGEQKRVEITYYDGLIGQTLSLIDKTFLDYEPVKKIELPSPTAPSLLSLPDAIDSSSEQIADNLTEIYNDYVSSMDPDEDDIVGSNDNCPYDYNPNQADSDFDKKGDACDFFDNLLVKIDDETATTVEEVFLEESEEVIEEIIEEEVVDELVVVPEEEDSIVEEDALKEPVIEEEIVEIVPELEVEIIELN